MSALRGTAGCARACLMPSETRLEVFFNSCFAQALRSQREPRAHQDVDVRRTRMFMRRAHDKVAAQYARRRGRSAKARGACRARAGCALARGQAGQLGALDLGKVLAVLRYEDGARSAAACGPETSCKRAARSAMKRSNAERPVASPTFGKTATRTRPEVSLGMTRVNSHGSVTAHTDQMRPRKSPANTGRPYQRRAPRAHMLPLKLMYSVYAQYYPADR